MPFRWEPREHLVLGKYVLKWLLLGFPVGAVIGSAVALFLWALDEATKARWATDTGSGVPWLLFFLPVAGVAIASMYHLLGKSVEGGNNLIMEQIHDPGGGVPSRMTPLVLAGTVVTHLFGGSAGREGTAVQMGGSIASTVGRWLRLSRVDTRTLLMSGVAAGFGAVFGTPLTGAIFAVEVLAVGTINFQSIIPCLIASIVGDWTTSAWGIHHTHYYIRAFSHIDLFRTVPQLSWLLLGKVAIAAVAFGLAGVLFAELAHGLQHLYKKAVPTPILRPALGGVLVIILAVAVGADYLGLGVSADPRHPDQVSIISSFREGGATYWSWWWKMLFTTVTLSSGFKGGEVTPLFFVGAALGNTMARLLDAPVDLLAGLGFIAVFAGATNTPLACTIMGIELFAASQPELLRSGFAVYSATACFISYLLSGHSGIYLSQRIGIPKYFSPVLPPDVCLRTARELRPSFGVGRLSVLAGSRATGKRPRDVARNNNVYADETASSNKLNHHRDANKPQTGDKGMPLKYKVNEREIGQIRIYMTPGEKRGGQWLKKMFSKPLYQEIITAAKKDGLLNAAAHHTHYGYSSNGKIQSHHSDMPNESVNLCVELIAQRDQLERFCRKHGDLLREKVIVYKHMEHWEIGPQEILKSVDVPLEELDVDVEQIDEDTPLALTS